MLPTINGKSFLEVTEDDYRNLLSKSELPDYWKDHAYFGQFVKDFYASTEVKSFPL